MSRLAALVGVGLLLCLTTAFAADAGVPAPQTKSGPIKSVDAKAQTFVLSLPARPLTFTVNESTAITLDGKTSSFSVAVQPERTAAVTYTKAGEERVASKVDVTTAAAK